MTDLTCQRCKGAKVLITPAFDYTDSVTGVTKHYAEKINPCHCCEGKGVFPALDREMIAKAIKGHKGLRSSRPVPLNGKKGYGDIQDQRAYYVWRMARFHGGADMTMPMTAGMLVIGDPLVPELDKLADEAAKLYFGSDMRAVHRWGRALGAF